jgi:hypothetical protein
MNNFLYDIAKDKLMMGELDLLSGHISASLVPGTAKYPPDMKTLDIKELVATVELKNKSVGHALFGADPTTFEDVERQQDVKAVIIHSGSIPIAYIGSAEYGLPFKTNGGPITMFWGKDKTKIFKL